MSDEKRFNEGDMVRLKSGGPLMAVSCYTEDGRVFCIWFDESKIYNSKGFEEDTLELVGKDDGTPIVMTG